MEWRKPQVLSWGLLPRRGGLFLYALAFLAGDLVLQQLPLLPPVAPLLAVSLAILLGLFVLLLWRSDCCCVWQAGLGSQRVITLSIICILLFICSFIYAALYAHQALSWRLQEADAGRDIVLRGVIAGLPESVSSKGRPPVIRFDFLPTSQQLTASDAAPVLQGELPRKIRLSWYGGRPVVAGERWQYTVRLKPPRGMLNPGGFDYEGWLFQQGYDARGYVRKSPDNRRLPDGAGFDLQLMADGIRQQLAADIDAMAAGSPFAQSFALIKALAIADRSSLTPTQWQTLADTGTSHLMAISGLHIGLAFLLGYVLLRLVLPAGLLLHCPAQRLAAAGGVLLAVLYALLAGMTIPTQRALIMLLALLAMQGLQRNHRPLDALGLAMLLVLLFDPLAVLSAGFWFSFAAVAVIFLAFRQTADEPPQVQLPDDQGSRLQQAWLSGRQRAARLWRAWLRLQLLLSLCLLPLSLYLFQQASLVAPLANLLMIPFISFVIVPLILLGLAGLLLHPPLGMLPLQLAAMLLEQAWPLLEALASLPFAVWVQGDIELWQILLASLLLSLALLKPPCPVVRASGRALMSVLAVAAAMAVLALPAADSLQEGEYRVHVLDVGQGTAVVVETRSRTLVYDSGARYSPRFDIGSAVIKPFLRQRRRSPDMLVISHGDADHIGGAAALLAAYPEMALHGQDIDTLVAAGVAAGKSECQRGQHWQWDGVYFEFLHPAGADKSRQVVKKRNNRSCVLRIASPYGRSLLTGDIEKRVEKELLATQRQRLAADLLLVAHHGSNTSSGSGFITAVSPDIAVISVAYRNRYRLPSQKVLRRYRQQGARLLQTWQSGAVSVEFSAEKSADVSLYRVQARRYWHRFFAPE